MRFPVRDRVVALLLLSTGGCVPTMSSPAVYEAQPISAEAGRSFFGELGGGDPYATGIAYPVFLALMEAYPERLGRDWNELAARFGFIPNPAAHGDPNALPVGFHLVTDPNSEVPWLVGNCQLCHAERIRLPSGDLVVPGLGNNHVRPHAYVDALLEIGADPAFASSRVEALATRRAGELHLNWRDVMRRPIVDASVAAMKKASAERGRARSFTAALPGRMATIESFAEAITAHGSSPIPRTSAVGWTKVPDVVGYPFRDTLSFDASGFGSPEALVVEADFLFGARPAWHAAHPHIATSMYLYLKSFQRHLRFPKPVDSALATQGRLAFEASCAKCHGFYVDYGGETRVAYRERVIPIEGVGTDRARLDAVSPAFVAAANGLSVARGYARVRNTGGYVPPVLLDVWARGLYGHAGQWPSLEVLATPPAARPRHFTVDTEGLYDLERIGVRYEVASSARPLKSSEYAYDGEKPGYGVEGHDFLARLDAGSRKAILEYLKTL